MPGQSFRGFAERVALVTGGAFGISRAIALQLAYEGAYVIVSHPHEEAESASVAGELREIGTLAHSFAADVSRASDVLRLFAGIEELYGRLDFLVNSASFEHAAAFEELTEEAWDASINVNLKSVFLCTQAAARLMRQRPKAAIVNLAADTSLGNTGRSAVYAAAQAGIIGLTKALAQELAPRIRVNCVAVRGSHQNQSPPANENAPAPDEVARACVYLLSSDAASITGQTLVVGS
ncbi:MAG TPA: SDR family oxidoreductase [Pyrinomonadaceae bacterium]